MVIWNGACHVHEEFSVESIIELKKEYPNAKVISHPECQKPVQLISDFVGSTAALLNFTKEDNANEYIVATESGILHEMKKQNSNKTYIIAPPKHSTCACNDCNFMKLITMNKIYNTLKYEKPEVILSDDIIKKAKKSIDTMLAISKKMNL